MTQKFDLKQVYTMGDLKKLQQAGASVEELRQAYQMMPGREEATKELAGLKENISLAKVKDLLEKGADVNAKNMYGDTALIYACAKGLADVEQLLEEVQAVQEERSAKAQEIRQVDSDTNDKPVDHSLRRTLFGGQQKGQNAPLNPTVARRMRDKMK